MRNLPYILGTRLWWRHALAVSGDACLTDFIERFSAYASPVTGIGLDPRLVRAWASGRRSVSRGMIQRVESEVPGTSHVFTIVPLLHPRRMSALAVRRLMAEHAVTAHDGRLFWRFPRERSSDVPLPLWDDSEALVDRGDFFGLLGLLALIREALARFDPHTLNICTHRLYRILPVVLRCPWVRPDVDLLLTCIETMLAEVRSFPVRVAVNWDTFRTAINSPNRNTPDSLVHIGPYVHWKPRPFPLLGEEVTPWRYGRVSKPSKAVAAKNSRLLGRGLTPVF